MGKQKIDRLLTQLKSSHQQDVQNAAAIFTVAQGAVNVLEQADEAKGETGEVRAIAPVSSQPPSQLTKADLISRHGNYNACRQAAKKAGIGFSKTPHWEQLIAAFNYIEACQICIDDYIAQNPNPNLKGIKITIAL